MKGRIKRSVTVIGAVTLAALLAVPGAALAKGGPPSGVGGGSGGGGHSGGGGGGNEPPTTELGNNLSVPVHFVPSTSGAPTLRVVDPAVTPSDPVGIPVSYTVNGVEGSYYLQKTASVWSAQFDTPVSASATATWGSNLTNGRALKLGKPIRVEMALGSTDSGIGYEVVKLTDELDRLADYGTLGKPTPMNFMVWTAGATLTIQKSGDATATTVPIAAEINSTGKVVYGYNWGVKSGGGTATSGTYVLTFTIPSTSGVTIEGVTEGEVLGIVSYTANTATVTVTVK